MSELKKPMLAETIESREQLNGTLQWPIFASPKLDGVRCLLDSRGRPYSRNGKEFFNPLLYEYFGILNLPEGLDGELGIGSPTDKEFFTRTSAWLRTKKNPEPPETSITFWIFDKIDTEPFTQRWKWIQNYVSEQDHGFVSIRHVPQHLCFTTGDIFSYEEKFVAEGYEGIILRGALSWAPYKHGRASWNSQELFKYKRFQDAEGVIVGFIQAERNENEAKKDAFGHTKRSGSKANKVKIERLGKFLVESPSFPTRIRGSKDGPLKIGTGIGLTHELRDRIWVNQDEYLGRIITFEYQAGSDYEDPRFPSFKGFRLEVDIPEPGE